MKTIKQTNIELFKVREQGQYKGMTEGRAQWLETLESHCTYKPNPNIKPSPFARDNEPEEGRVEL